jgi:predicted ATPase/class 3 adenylate cyclase
MHQFVPHFILNRFAAGQTRGGFPAAGLFVDISGFSTITDSLMVHGQHGAEVLAGVMRKAFTPLFLSVHEQGGFIATRAGDAFTALFPQEDDPLAPQRALAAATSIQTRLTAQSRQATPYGEYTIYVKVGLALGEVSWGTVSSKDGRRATYYFQGPAVDGCAAAEHHANAGEVVLDALAHQQLQDLVTTEAADEYFRLTAVEARLPAALPVNLPQPDLDLVARFLPREVVTQPPGGEFRQVTHLFVNLPTVRTEAQLDIFMQNLFELQDQYGSLLSRLDFGDKGSNLLLFWGALAAFENDVERCLNFVLDLQAQTSIPISAGVTYQLAHTGLIGSDLSEEYTCFGRGVNLAARFMSIAPRGEIWLDESAAKRAAQRFDLDFVGEKEFKGFSEKQKVYLLLERKRESELIFTGKMVGREAEFNRLAEFVQPIFKGQFAGVMSVRGEAGIGKSRLVHEFKKSPIFDGLNEATWAVCQTDEILRQSLNPFRYWLKRHFEQSIEQSEARNKKNFNHKLDELIEATPNEDLAGELDRTRSFLGALLDLRWPDSLYEQLDAQGRYDNTFIAIASLLKAISRQQPLVLLIEDAHWIDNDSMSFLAYLIRAVNVEERQSYPIAILVTARYEGQALHLDDTSPVQEIDLGGLSKEDMVDMVEALLGEGGTPALIDRLNRHAEGNPFFAEQILRYLQEEGLLVKSDVGWMLHEQSLEQSPLPTDVRAILVARLDRLAREVRAVVQTAAVLGREFEVRLLSLMLQGDEALPQKIAQAEQAAIWTALNELRYIFKHALLQDAAYHMQLRTRREEIHRLATEALEVVYADELRYHYGELAYHSEKAGLAERAREYLRLAGDTAREAYQNSLAADYYGRAIKLTPTSECEASYRLHLAREAVNNLLGKRDAQHQDLMALQSLAMELEDVEKQVEVKIRRAEYLSNIGNNQEAFAEAERAIAQANEASRSKTAIGAYRIAGDALNDQGDYKAAIRYAKEGIALARQSGDRSLEALIQNLLGMIALNQQDLTNAKTCFEQSLNIFREIGELRSQAFPLNNLGMLSGSLGDYTAAEDYFNQSLAIAREIGHRTGEGKVLGNLGWVSGAQGDFARARAYAEQMVRIGREVGSRESELFGLTNLSMCAGMLSEFQTALNCAEQALEIARLIHDRNGEAWALTYQGHALLALNRAADAEAAYRLALDIRGEMDQPVLAAEPGAGLARAALERGDLPAAQAHITPILARVESGGTLDGTDEPLRVYLTCYFVLRAVRDARSGTILDMARTMLLERSGAIKNETIRLAFLQDIPYHREILKAWEMHQKNG